MLAFVSDLPERYHLNTTGRSLAALFIGVPLFIVLSSVVMGGMLALAEGVSLWNGFRYTIGIACQLGNPLTDIELESAIGRIVAIVVGVASQGLVGVIAGIVSGMGAISSGVDRFSACFSKKDEPVDINGSSMTPTFEAAENPKEEGCKADNCDNAGGDIELVETLTPDMHGECLSGDFAEAEISRPRHQQPLQSKAPAAAAMVTVSDAMKEDDGAGFFGDNFAPTGLLAAAQLPSVPSFLGGGTPATSSGSRAHDGKKSNGSSSKSWLPGTTI